MRFRLATTLLALTASFTFAQKQSQRKLCDTASAATIHRDAGVIVEKVILSGKWGSNEATVYVPDKDIADGAVVFSHSAIQTETGSSVDLLPFALTLARAGAAVIVPLRSLVWPPTDSVNQPRRRSGHLRRALAGRPHRSIQQRRADSE